jgi:hypothetical protein
MALLMNEPAHRPHHRQLALDPDTGHLPDVQVQVVVEQHQNV